MPRRRALLTLALGTGVGVPAPALVRHARAADAPRFAPIFALGIASGQPRPDGMVLWTRLSGDHLPPQVDVAWELAHDEAFTRIAARGVETALAADAHSVHAEPAGLEPARWYWYRFGALGQRSAVGRTRTAPAADAPARLEFAIASCQRWDMGHYAAWRHLAAEPLDLVLFLGDYIYEYPSLPTALRRHDGLLPVQTLAQYRARYAQYKSDPALQAAHAACPWLVIADDHEVQNDYAGLHSATLPWGFAAQRADAYRAWWEHMPLPKSARPTALDQGGRLPMADRLDWGRLARIHLLDTRQHRDVQACPKFGRGGANTVAVKDCPELLDPKRSLLGAAQERWLADGWSLQRPWNLLAQQTLMARWSDADTAAGGGTAWTDGWDGHPLARRRLLATVAERRVPGVVVLGGDVHAHCVADLKTDFDDPTSPVVASEFCGTSISSLGRSQARMQAALPFNPHVHLARSDRRGAVRFSLDATQLQARLLAVDDARDPDSGVQTLARFVVAAGQPGPRPA